MLGNRTFLAFLLAWLVTLGAAPALLKSKPPASSRPEPIVSEPETVTAVSVPAGLD
jgi:hypothetical protein